MPPASSSAGPSARKGLLGPRGLKAAPRKAGPSQYAGASGSGSSGLGRTGPSAKGGDEGYLYLAGVKDMSKRVGEFSVSYITPQ